MLVAVLSLDPDSELFFFKPKPNVLMPLDDYKGLSHFSFDKIIQFFSRPSKFSGVGGWYC